MNSPKRKVTDLLPAEAILISSDADLKVLEEFEKAGIKWADGKLASKFNPLEFTQRTSICVFYDSGSLWFSVPNNYEFTVSATDFIQTEAEKVEVDEPDISKEVNFIYATRKLAKWILENRVSSLIDADIPQEDKDRIARHFGYSADLTNP